MKRVATAPELLQGALEALSGPSLVLDAQLRVIWASESARALLGTDVPPGTRAPRLLCGEAVARPIAEALAHGKAVTGTIERPTPEGGKRFLTVSATPFGALRSGKRSKGWIVVLSDEGALVGTGDAPVLFHGMWTRDPTMKQVFHVLERAARRDASVLIRGETGTGKELVARALHELSPRRRGPFAAINCAAVPGSLLESQLFGHVRGAFTGAVRDQPGFFRATNGGTLFLDEVAELPLELQAKLLRVLETRSVIPVGGQAPLPVDVRIVAATHQSLRRATEKGTFRADLMYRLRVIPLYLPPLRQRVGDVRLLTEKLIEELNARGHDTEGARRVLRIAPAALEVLERYPWPGNVRELRNALEYAYVVGEGPVLQVTELPPEIVDPNASPDRDVVMVNVAPELPAQPSAEVARIRRALERAGGHRERAAQILGISRVTLWRRMRELGLSSSAGETSLR